MEQENREQELQEQDTDNAVDTAEETVVTGEADTEETAGSDLAENAEDTASADVEEGNDPEAGEEDSDAEKKGFFSKKKKKDKRDEQIEELTDRVKRTMAEFENFRKRTEREKSQMYEIGARDVIEKMLPVLDNFERGIQAIPQEELQSPVGEGMNMIYKQMLTAFEQIGVETIEAVGQPFDPNLHNAVMHVEDEEAGENVVVEEFQKGYKYRDTIIRHSMVKVAN